MFERVDVEPFFSPADVRVVEPGDVPTATSDRGDYEGLDSLADLSAVL